MGLYIRDDRVKALAAELAERRGCTLTDAVRTALEEQLKHLAEDRAEKLRRTRALAAAMRGLPELRPGFTDRDLYDEDGNPVL